MVQEEKLSLALSEFARTLVTDFPLESILGHLVKQMVEVLPVTSAGVTLISAGAKPRYIAASDEAALRYEAIQTDLGEGPCLLAFTSGKAVLVSDLRHDDRFPRFAAVAIDAGLAAVFTFPLHQDDIRLGALDLYRDTPGALDPNDLIAAQTLADMAASYMTNVQGRADAHALADGFRRSSLHDLLTGLPNRLLLQQRLEHATQRGRRSHNPAALLFADLDHFKAVNDTHGHQVGDALLIAVSRRLAALLRPGDTLARVSGDEFVILCEDLSEAADVEQLAERIDAAFTVPFSVLGVEVAITASVGIAFAGRGEDISERLMNDADTAMYQAKRKGGAGHQVIDLPEASRVIEWLALERDLQEAVASDQLQVFYQPVVRAADGLVTGVEALLRWTHPKHGPVSPQTIVTMAEQNGLIGKIGAWVLERACIDRNDWVRRLGLTQFEVAVNVSTTQLVSPGFSDEVAAVLHRTGTDSHALILEITEDIFIDESSRAVTVLHELKQLGVKVALDDFGTGYSSLSYLRRFPVDVLKIDRTFLTDIGQDPISARFLAGVTDLAHILGLSVTAEGVETVQQRNEVVAVGCESCQGFYFARPMPADAVFDLLTSAAGQPVLLPLTAGELPVSA
jgi:diguanylate cyclase (GGDEF)-like protein